MKPGQKIMVIVCSGSGKSTLSKELRDVTGLSLRRTLMQPNSFSDPVLKQLNGCAGLFKFRFIEDQRSHPVYFRRLRLCSGCEFTIMKHIKTYGGSAYVQRHSD